MKKVSVYTTEKDAVRVEEELEGYLHYRSKLGEEYKYTVFVPDDELDTFTERMQKSIDLRFKKSAVVVEPVDFILSSFLKRKSNSHRGGKPPVEELLASTEKYARVDVLYILLTTIAGLIALTGLFLNNVAVIIGAMLLSPLLGPIYSFAINVSVGRANNAARSIVLLFISLGVVIVVSYLSTLLLSLFFPVHITPEILLRFDKNPIYLIMAFLLGFASILSLSRGISESIAGIAIAAALLPPAVVVGISIAMVASHISAPFLMLMENIIGLLAGAMLAMPLLGISPRYYYEKKRARKYLIRAGAVLVGLLILLAIISLL